MTKIIACILDTLRADPSLEFEEGLAMLFFESIKVSWALFSVERGLD